MHEKRKAAKDIRCMSCAGLSQWVKKGGNMKLSDYLKSIDHLDERMEKAVIIAEYEKMFG